MPDVKRAHKDTGSLWTAPSNPRHYTLFAGATTYTRPGIAYIALRRILGPRKPGERHRARLEAGFSEFLPNPTPACIAKLNRFFTQWFDTVYPPSGGRNRPQIMAAGLRRQ